MTENENTTEQDSDSFVDAICAVCAVAIAVVTAVYWVSNQ